jgi:hypothetical protein
VKKLVGRRTVNYLIDTLGREFRVANGIEYLDSSIQALDIRNSQITNLPLKIFKNKQLKILLLSGNKIKEISSEIGTMPNLLGVDLSNNELDSIPSTFEGLKNLNWLNLSENLLTHLPNEIGNLDNLSILDVGWNKITALPSTIGNLNSLTLLNLNGNYLSNLPSQIGGFRNIEFIDLSNNWIEQLPIEVGQLTKLIWLNCSNNRLVELPKDLGNLTNLRWIDVSYNFLKSIPNEFKNLKKLNWLILKNNLINDTEKQLINEYMTDCEVKDIESLEDLFKKYSLQLSEELQKTPIDTIETTHIYNRLSWNQLVRSQFSDAENTIRRGLKNKPDDIFLNANLPLSLILQNNDNKTKEAIQLYDSWKGKPFGELRLPFFRDAFLGDLKTFERSGIIPKHRIVDIEKLRRQILFH